MSSVFVIMADAEYECNHAIRCYSSKEDADSFIAAIREYDLTWRSCPGIEDSEDNDKDWKKWDRWKDGWDKKHPAGKEWASYRHAFSITEVPLFGDTP